MPRGWIFQQDNDPKHCANFIKDFFNSTFEKKIDRIYIWALRKPDLNPTEYLWELLDCQLKGEKPTNKNDLLKNLSNC